MAACLGASEAELDFARSAHEMKASMGCIDLVGAILQASIGGGRNKRESRTSRRYGNISYSIHLTFIIDTYDQDPAEQGQTTVSVHNTIVVCCPQTFSEVATS